jgi:hypothetical protein
MKRRISVFGVFVLWLLGLAGGALGRQQADNRVEPSDLERREDLIGREVVVDDRVKFYVIRKGSEDDQLELKRTSVPFRVPQRLRPPAHSRMTAVVVHGILKRDEGRLVCDVTSLQIVPNDLERLERGLAGVTPRDYATRKAWARWAQRRATDFGEEQGPLMKRARELEAEVLHMEGELKRGAVNAPQEWLAMAQDARRRKVPEPGPSAMAHRALRAKLAAADDVASLEDVVREIAAFFPNAAKDHDSARVNLARWEAPYADDPSGTYRDHTASEEVRKALDRRLWADARERLLDHEPIPDLPAGVALSEQATSLLPEKPDLPARLLNKTVGKYRQDLASLRLDEVKALAQVYREKLKQPDEALKVLRDWLEIKRARLSDTDADGPVSLAVLYEQLLQDRVTAVELLRKSWRIDPTSKETEEAFRIRGFRKRKDEWVEILPGAEADSGSDRPKATRSSVTTGQGLLGLTADEVRLKLNGRPSRVNYSVSRGQLIEQWIYHLDNNSARYVNLLHAPGTVKPRVVADYTLPRITPKGGFGSAR